MATNINDDEYVANLLKQDAKSARKKYDLVGIDAFSHKRLKSGAPKPNTNFLRNIIRQTDTHNAALLAREADESNARLKRMDRERQMGTRREDIRKERKAEGRLTPVQSDQESGRSLKRRADHNDDEATRGKKHRRADRPVYTHSRRVRDKSRDAQRGKRKHEDSDEDRSAHQSRHHHDRGHRHKHSSDDEQNRPRSHHKSNHRHKRQRSRSNPGSHSRSRSPRPSRKHKHRDRSLSPKRASQDHKSEHKPSSESRKTKRRSTTPASDSDPLEAIVGPLPPPAPPKVRSRGRGAHNANAMGMDSRFSSGYDPTIDARQDSDVEDNWGEAVEAFRDRQKWKQQGADRLKAAGFTDDQVRKWEKGDDKDEEDVTWTKHGQAREWDRGKVVDEDGDVDLKADWGRLK